METFIGVVVFVVLTALWWHFINNRFRGKLPPGPIGFPIVGHLHMLGDLPHRNLYRLAKKYGPIMHIRLGSVPTIVVSSPQGAELVVKTHDNVFASRPKFQAAEHIFHGQKNLAFGQYGAQWRNLRKMCMMELLSSSKIESLRPMRKEEVTRFVKKLKDAAEARTVVDVTDTEGSLIEDMTFRMIIGRSKDQRFDFRTSVVEIMNLLGAFNIADFVPIVGALDLQGLNARLMAVGKVMDGILEGIIDEHVRDAKEQKFQQHRDFIDIMLAFMTANSTQEELDRPTMKAIVLDMIIGAMDTSTTTIEWALSELIRNPRTMKRLQSELESVVGLNRMVEEADLPKLNYLDSVVKESMRLHPSAPLLLPRESMKDITINGYYIPKKSRVILNVWAIGRDPQVWSDNVNEFYPERFMETTVDFRGYDMRFMPFGSGRRACPGTQLGATVVQLIMANLVHCFNWELPNGVSPADLDMSELFGLTVPRANHLRAIPTYRLCVNQL